MKRLFPLLFSLVSIFAYAENNAPAQQNFNSAPQLVKDSVTDVMIRARAKDAKFIGTSIGGAKIVVRHAETGEILDRGKTSGSTGNTKLLMVKPQERRAKLTDDRSAGFSAHLNIKKPTLISIEVIAPANQRQSAVMVSKQQWVFPGDDIKGDGIILEVPGFIVDMTTPAPHNVFEAGADIPVKANIMMMCGCPIKPDGLWDANDYEVSVSVYKDDKKVKEVPLDWKETSVFGKNINLESGLYELNLKIIDNTTGNTGLDRTNIIVK